MTNVQESQPVRGVAKERRLRLRRQQARIRLQLDCDAGLLHAHHASAVPTPVSGAAMPSTAQDAEVARLRRDIEGLRAQLCAVMALVSLAMQRTAPSMPAEADAQPGVVGLDDGLGSRVPEGTAGAASVVGVVDSVGREDRNYVDDGDDSGDGLALARDCEAATLEATGAVATLAGEGSADVAMVAVSTVELEELVQFGDDVVDGPLLSGPEAKAGAHEELKHAVEGAVTASWVSALPSIESIVAMSADDLAAARAEGISAAEWLRKHGKG